jgi:glutathione S-transferase
VILHITDADTWAASQAAGEHTSSTRGRSLAEEGFIHCSRDHQVESVLAAFYADATDLLLLHIDDRLLTAPWRDEDVPGAGVFPHVYGPINLDAVVRVEAL